MNQRATLKVSVMNKLQKNKLNRLENQSQLYLYGHRSINSTENKKNILATIKYIKDTRFLNLVSLLPAFGDTDFT